MNPAEFALIVLVVSMGAGFLGSLLGLGGGIVVVPTLTLLLHVDVRLAIGASVISVIATSSGAAAAYVRERMTNLRVAMFLEMGTTSGALTGAYLAGVVNPRWLFVVFGFVLAYSALVMLRERRTGGPRRSLVADRLLLHGTYVDEAQGAREILYKVGRPAAGLGLMYVAGTASGLLGIGSGALKVPALDLAMGLPIKVSTATSNFMIGVTAAASAGVYFARGQIDPFVAAPVAVGVLAGATLGSRLLGRLHGRVVRVAFVIVLLFVAAQMLWKGLA